MRLLSICIVAISIAACDGTESIEHQIKDAGEETNLSLGSSCRCVSSGDLPCCADGLFCFTDEYCNIETDSGCYTLGSCISKRSWGQPCDGPHQCADEDATCSGTSDESPTCTPPPLGEERCNDPIDCSPGRTCKDSYCLLRPGERCSASNQCASNKCYGTSPLDYHCL